MAMQRVAERPLLQERSPQRAEVLGYEPALQRVPNAEWGLVLLPALAPRQLELELVGVTSEKELWPGRQLLQ